MGHGHIIRIERPDDDGGDPRYGRCGRGGLRRNHVGTVPVGGRGRRRSYVVTVTVPQPRAEGANVPSAEPSLGPARRGGLVTGSSFRFNFSRFSDFSRPAPRTGSPLA